MSGPAAVILAGLLAGAGLMVVHALVFHRHNGESGTRHEHWWKHQPAPVRWVPGITALAVVAVTFLIMRALPWDAAIFIWGAGATYAGVMVARHKSAGLVPPEPGPAPEPVLVPGTVEVARDDLDYLLAHYWDEVLGSPERGHWQLPLLRAAATRLAEATWQQLEDPESAEPKD